MVFRNLWAVPIGEGIIEALDRRSGQLKSTLPGRHRVPYFIYTGCRCRRGCWCLLHRLPLLSRGCRCRRRLYRRGLPRLHRTLAYTGTPGVDDKVPVERYDHTLPPYRAILNDRKWRASNFVTSFLNHPRLFLCLNSGHHRTFERGRQKSDGATRKTFRIWYSKIEQILQV